MLRYGLTSYRGQGMAPNMQAVMLTPAKGKMDALRKTLGSLFATSASLMDEGGETREDLKMPERPEELVKSIREGFDAGDSLILAVVKAMGEEHVMACKKDTS